MSSGNLGANSGLAFRNNRIRETNDIDPLPKQAVSHFLGQSRVPYHNWDNRMVPWKHLKPCFGYTLPEILCVLAKPVQQLRRAAQYLDAFSDAQAIAGARVFENRYGRLRCRNISTISFAPM